MLVESQSKGVDVKITDNIISEQNIKFTNGKWEEILIARKLQALLSYKHTNDLKGKTRQSGLKQIAKMILKRGQGLLQKFWRGEKWLPGITKATGSRNSKAIAHGNLLDKHIDQIRVRFMDVITENRKHFIRYEAVPK